MGAFGDILRSIVPNYRRWKRSGARMMTMCRVQVLPNGKVTRCGPPYFVNDVNNHFEILSKVLGAKSWMFEIFWNILDPNLVCLKYYQTYADPIVGFWNNLKNMGTNSWLSRQVKDWIQMLVIELVYLLWPTVNLITRIIRETQIPTHQGKRFRGISSTIQRSVVNAACTTSLAFNPHLYLHQCFCVHKQTQERCSAERPSVGRPNRSVVSVGHADVWSG